MAVNSQLLNRGATQQDFSGDAFGVDTNAQRTFRFTGHEHQLTFGIDYRRTREDRLQKTCRVAALNVYNPVYGAAITARPATAPMPPTRCTRSASTCAIRSAWPSAGS